MPELPEVQTVVSDLNKKIKGDTIVSFWSDFPKAIKNATLEKFQKDIKNRKILEARRIGKNIFIDLSGTFDSTQGKKTLYLHLKMTGHLLVKRAITNNQDTSTKGKKNNSKNKKLPASNSNRGEQTKNYFNDKVNNYIHHRWKLKDKKGNIIDLDFSDLRKFAKIVLVDTDKIMELPSIKKLGIDAMDPKFDLKKFAEILEGNSARGRSALGGKPIGVALMDQETIAGIGNIYRSEILFAAGVDPRRKISSLKKEEVKKIFLEIKRILAKAIEMRGTSDSDYRDTSGAPGQFHKMLKVYRKDKEKCSSRNGKKCGKIIERITMAQRSVFFCPSCQK